MVAVLILRRAESKGPSAARMHRKGAKEGAESEDPGPKR
jgi:hypothetical protein